VTATVTEAVDSALAAQALAVAGVTPMASHPPITSTAGQKTASEALGAAARPGAMTHHGTTLTMIRRRMSFTPMAPGTTAPAMAAMAHAVASVVMAAMADAVTSESKESSVRIILSTIHLCRPLDSRILPGQTLEMTSASCAMPARASLKVCRI